MQKFKPCQMPEQTPTETTTIFAERSKILYNTGVFCSHPIQEWRNSSLIFRTIKFHETISMYTPPEYNSTNLDKVIRYIYGDLC